MSIRTYLKLSLYVFVLAVCIGQIAWAGSFASPAASDTMQNIRINSDATTELQNEEMIVINPLNTDQVVAVWRDFRFGHREVGHGYSTDGGASWSDALFFSDVVNPDYSWESDPGLGILNNGTFVAHTLCIDPFADNSDICVYISTDGGQNWSLPTFVVGGDFGFEDKQWMGIDRSNSANSGNIYFAWTRFPDFDVPAIMFSKSVDTAQTWGPIVQLSNGINSVQWPTVTTDHNGKIYVAWVNYSPASIRMRTSTDGETFLSEQTVVSTSHGSTTLNGGVLAFSFPAMEADVSDSSPYQGNVYIAYMTRPLGDEDIYFVKSTNAGASWSTPLRINDDATGNGKDQFFPWISVNEDGVITAAFMDRRNSPSNFEYDFYITQSFDGGDNWTPNLRISNASSSPAMAALSAGTFFDPQKQPMAASPTAGLLGEYLGVSSVDRYVNLIWTDTRLGNQDALGSRFSGFYPPFLSSPVNQSNISDTTPLFQWTTAGFYDTASAFSLQIASDSSFAVLETTIIAIDTSFLQIQAADALDLGVHFWRVKGFNSSGDSSLYSRTFKFTLYMEGDPNGDGTITLADVIFLVNYLFKNGSPAPVPFISGDPNCNNQISLADVIQLVNLLFNKPGDWTPCSHS